jgi:Leucine-rich repeat (LRR) protein
LKNLPRLQTLIFKANPVGTVSPWIFKLYQTELSITSIQMTIVNISVECLRRLKVVNLSYNQLHDISPLQHAFQVTRLNLSFSRIQTIHALASLSLLESLNVSFNSTVDIRPLSSLRNLVELDVKNQMTPISELKSLSLT